MPLFDDERRLLAGEQTVPLWAWPCQKRCKDDEHARVPWPTYANCAAAALHQPAAARGGGELGGFELRLEFDRPARLTAQRCRFTDVPPHCLTASLPHSRGRAARDLASQHGVPAGRGRWTRFGLCAASTLALQRANAQGQRAGIVPAAADELSAPDLMLPDPLQSLPGPRRKSPSWRRSP